MNLTPEQLSEELRHGVGVYLTCRRWIVGLSLANAALLAFLALYQIGILRRLPDPPLPGIDSNRVDAGRDAYAKLWMPDGILGALAYLVTAALAAMGGKDRWSGGLWWVVLLMAAKTLFDVYNAGKLTVISWAHYRAFCIYCLTVALFTFATLPLVVPETWRPCGVSCRDSTATFPTPGDIFAGPPGSATAQAMAIIRWHGGCSTLTVTLIQGTELGGNTKLIPELA
jgi:hypothetical protein